MRAAKDRKEEFYDPAREEDISRRNKTRLELWEEHLKDPIVALDKALKCLGDQYESWLEALWKQGSNGMRSGGDAQPLRSGTFQGGTAVWRALLLPSGEGANGPQGAESAGAQHPAAWRASPPFDAEEADFCARQRGLQLLHRGWFSGPRIVGRK